MLKLRLKTKYTLSSDESYGVAKIEILIVINSKYSINIIRDILSLPEEVTAFMPF